MANLKDLLGVCLLIGFSLLPGLVVAVLPEGLYWFDRVRHLLWLLQTGIITVEVVYVAYLSTHWRDQVSFRRLS